MNFIDFEDMRRERNIKRVLRALAKQRIAMILPDGTWVIEKSPCNLPFQDESLRTCLMRGWVEILHESVRSGKLTDENKMPEGELFNSTSTIYRLTEAGWFVIHRTQFWVLATFIVSTFALISTMIAAI